jgi:hypothetical protein
MDADDSFLDHMYLGDRKTTITKYFEAGLGVGVMDELPLDMASIPKQNRIEVEIVRVLGFRVEIYPCVTLQTIVNCRLVVDLEVLAI